MIYFYLYLVHQANNVHVYCANNPVNLVDPDGEKIIYVNGLSAFGAGKPGEDYWRIERTIEKYWIVLQDPISVLYLDRIPKLCILSHQ